MSALVHRFGALSAGLLAVLGTVGLAVASPVSPITFTAGAQGYTGVAPLSAPPTGSGLLFALSAGLLAVGLGLAILITQLRHRASS